MAKKKMQFYDVLGEPYTSTCRSATQALYQLHQLDYFKKKHSDCINITLKKFWRFRNSTTQHYNTAFQLLHLSVYG